MPSDSRLHPNDPATYEPLDAELTEDDDMDDAEREARLREEHEGCYPPEER
jgi:hypothetical protein